MKSFFENPLTHTALAGGPLKLHMDKTHPVVKRLHVPVKAWKGGTSFDARKEQIAALLENDQPFVLARYLVTVPLVDGACDWLHEIILWQSRSGDREQASLILTPRMFRDLVEAFDMRQADRIDEGEIYECNSLLRDLSEEYRKEMDRHRDAVETAKKNYMVKKDGYSRSWTMRLRQRLTAAEAAYSSASQQFLVDHNIYTYTFAGERGLSTLADDGEYEEND